MGRLLDGEHSAREVAARTGYLAGNGVPMILVLLALACTPDNGNPTRSGSPRETEETPLDDTATGDTGGGGGGGTSDVAAWADDFAEVLCERFFECSGSEAVQQLGYETVEECTAAFQEQFAASLSEATCPEFDPEAAAACIDTYAESSCADLAGGDPAVCNRVCG
jgi:hypothetical protein